MNEIEKLKELYRSKSLSKKDKTYIEMLCATYYVKLNKKCSSCYSDAILILIKNLKITNISENKKKALKFEGYSINANNNLCNLEWCTASYNSKHAFILGKQPSAFKSENNVANKKCICLKTNKIFNSLKQAWKETNYPKCYQTFLRNMKNENYKDTKVKLWN